MAENTDDILKEKIRFNRKFIEDSERKTGVGMSSLSRLIDTVEQCPETNNGKECMEELHSLFTVFVNAAKSHENRMKNLENEERELNELNKRAAAALQKQRDALKRVESVARHVASQSEYLKCDTCAEEGMTYCGRCGLNFCPDCFSKDHDCYSS